ncbi:MAG: DUF3302 domain-containing protein [Deltaproteobacteria bacterium]|nr:DUF3302 domain-containing protein [Deltaproteobacteria bacterium]
MTGLDYFTFVVLILLTGAGLAGAVFLGSLPGKIAADRGHPQADAIRVAGWLGLLTMGLFFPIALIWAYTRPPASKEIEALRQEVDRLRDRVDGFERGGTPAREEGVSTS